MKRPQSDSSIITGDNRFIYMENDYKLTIWESGKVWTCKIEKLVTLKNTNKSLMDLRGSMTDENALKLFAKALKFINEDK